MAIAEQLNTVVQYLVTAEGQIATGTFGTGQRPWLNFSAITPVGKFDIDGLKKLFSRQEINNQYVTARNSPTTTSGNIQSAKLSADYLAGCQRDYTMRTRSRIRMLIHGGNRAAANGLEIGPLRRNSIDWITRIISEQ